MEGTYVGRLPVLYLKGHKRPVPAGPEGLHGTGFNPVWAVEAKRGGGGHAPLHDFCSKSGALPGMLLQVYCQW